MLNTDVFNIKFHDKVWKLNLSDETFNNKTTGYLNFALNILDESCNNCQKLGLRMRATKHQIKGVVNVFMEKSNLRCHFP